MLLAFIEPISVDRSLSSMANISAMVDGQASIHYYDPDAFFRSISFIYLLCTQYSTDIISSESIQLSTLLHAAPCLENLLTLPA